MAEDEACCNSGSVAGCWWYVKVEGFWFCVERRSEVAICELNCEVHEYCGVGEWCKFPGESHCVYQGLKCIPFSCVNVVVVI